MAEIILYGIPNCDAVKKAQNWFKQKKVEIVFWDYKKSGISKEKLNHWCNEAGWQTLLNKRSTTWRNLSPADQAKIKSQASAVKLMADQTSIIKRPVIEYNAGILVGFDEANYKMFLIN